METTQAPLIIDKHSPREVWDQLPDLLDRGFLLNIDKPYAWTSADVVRKVKFALKKTLHRKDIKLGHAGTLDPLATGVLVLCAGRATKQAEYYLAQDKEYVAECCFGATTASFDLETEPDTTFPWEHITREALEAVLQSFQGPQDQVPPAYSAKMINGMRSYEWLRQGIEPPRSLETKPIVLHRLDLLDFAPPLATLRVHCTKGTYIRALARDLGVALQSGAYLNALRRTASGTFSETDSLTLEDLIKTIESLEFL